MEAPTGYTTSGWQRRDAPLGTLVYRAGLLTAEQVEEALKESVERGHRLGQVLVEKGLVEESEIARLLAEQRGLQYISIRNRPVDHEAVRLLPSEFAWANTAIPVWFDAGEPVVAIEDPTDETTIVKIAEAIGRSHRVVVATRSEILRLLSEWHPSPGEVSGPPLPHFELGPTTQRNGAGPAEQGSSNGAPHEPLPTLNVTPATEPSAFPVDPAVTVEASAVHMEAPVAPETVVSPEPVTAPVAQPEVPVGAEPVSAPEPVAPEQPVAEAPVEAPPAPAEFTPPSADPAPAVTPEDVVAPAASPLGTVSIPASVDAPAPPTPAPPAEPLQPTQGSHRLVARLIDGEQFELGSFATVEEARDQARGLITSLQGDVQDWPFVHGRFIRPESIVSLDVLDAAG